jgi:hypothetical protein
MKTDLSKTFGEAIGRVLSKEGTSDGAKLGWETRRGGGAPEVEGKWDVNRAVGMKEEEFKASPPKGFVYDSRSRAEANRHSHEGKITVGPKFFKLDAEGQKHVILHEIGHDLADAMNSDLSSFRLAEEGAFGPRSPETGEMTAGINGQYTPQENVAEAYAVLNDDPEWLKARYPKAYAEVGRRAMQEGLELPQSVIEDLRS